MNIYDQRKILIEEKVSVALALVAGFFLCVASVIMFTNMITRTTADINIKLVYELSQLCGAGVASFTIPYATIKGAHTEMDIITSHLKPRLRAALEGVAGIVTVVVMVFTVYMLADYAYLRTLALETTTTNHLPIYILRWVYALGMLLTLITAAIEMVDAFRVAMGKNVVRNIEEQQAFDLKLAEDNLAIEEKTQKEIEEGGEEL